jgi:hypothetical protein
MQPEAKGLATMKRLGFVTLSISLILALLLPQSAPAADSLKLYLGDSGIGESRIAASYKGSPGFGADIYLQPCSSAIKVDCIESVNYQNAGGSNWISLQTDEKIVFPAAGVPRFGTSPDNIVERITAYPEDMSRNLPAGGMTPVYKDSLANPDNGVRYLVQVRVQGTLNSDATYSWRDLRFDIKPVSVSSYSQLNQFGFPTLQLLPNFDYAKLFKIKVRSKATKNLLSGWFYGRVFEPEVSYTAIDNDVSAVEIVGAPITTPVAEGDLSSTEYAAIQSTSGSALPTFPPAATVATFGATYGFVNGSGAMKVWKLLSPVIKDRAASSLGVFSLRNSKNSALLTDYYPQGCQASQSLDGVVSTNATMYNPAPPSYDSLDGSLNFEVGSPHMDATGKVIQGVYSMVVNSKIAKCIWGSDLTNSRATVSIINDAGQSQVTTSVLKELNNFYYFHISGFTYSSKKISIRLVPAPAVTPTPNVSATTIPKAMPAVKKITCVKGKVKKVVSGVKPVCPKGYKLK